VKHGNSADLSVNTVYLRFTHSLKDQGFARLSIRSQMIAENEPSACLSQEQLAGWVQLCNMEV